MIDVTGSKLPQTSRAHPRTPLPPLPVKKIAEILGGELTVGEPGIVRIDVSRKHGVRLGGVEVKPELGLADGAAAVVPDFSMTAGEIQPVMATMRHYGWDVGCLYNHETAGSPQLYFSHMFTTGDPVRLAHQIRAGLEPTDVS